MQEQIDKIELVLENCEVITIDGKYIGDFLIEDVEYSLSRLAANYIDETYRANHFSISINRNANIKDDIMLTIGGKILDKQFKFDRLHSIHDIVSIYIHINQGWFKKPIVKIFDVRWYYDENNLTTDWTNYYQKTHINQFGDLFIVVDKNKEVSDVFDLEKIEDAEDVDFKWKMYG